MSALEEPDKGHAWVVLLGACLINAILSGMARMIGLLYVAVIDVYGVTRQQASFPFTVRNAVRYLAGPVTGVLGQTYGIRSVTFWGGVVAAAGSILCAFAPSVDWIVLFWGVVHGTGFALANTLFQVVINQYFERHRATASGVVLSGACVGALLFPFVIDALLSEYGLYGCFLLLGGLFLHVLPPSLLLKEPPWVKNPEAYARMRALLLNSPPVGKVGGASSAPKKTDFGRRTDLVSGLKGCEQSPVVCTTYRSIDINVAVTAAIPMNGIDNLAYVPERDEAVGKRSIVESCSPKKNPNSILQNIREIPRLYLNPIYVLISLSVAAYFSSFLPIVAVIVDYSRDKGIPTSYEKFLIYSFTIGDLLGRLGFGWVTDRRYVSFPTFMMLTFVLQAVFLVLLTLSAAVVVNMAVLGLYGCTAGVAIVYFPLLVHRYVEQENQAIGIGCIGLLSSVATFGIPPLIGHFRDDVGSYDGLFYIIASISAVMGVLWLLVPIYEKMRTEAKKPAQK